MKSSSFRHSRVREEHRSRGDRNDKGGCSTHIWCSRRELDLYEHINGSLLPGALYHEMCRGALVVSAYQEVTDISKLIVGINAYKRALDMVEDSDNVTMRERVLATSDINGRKSWLRVYRRRDDDLGRAARRVRPYYRRPRRRERRTVGENNGDDACDGGGRDGTCGGTDGGDTYDGDDGGNDATAVAVLVTSTVPSVATEVDIEEDKHDSENGNTNKEYNVDNDDETYFGENNSVSSSFEQDSSAAASSSYIVPEKRMLRLFFAFGDFSMMNCEDGYVVSRDVPFVVDSIVCSRFSITPTVSNDRVSFVSRMRLEYPLNHGAILHVGTFRSWSPIRFSSNNAIFVKQRRRCPTLVGSNGSGGYRNDATSVIPYEYDAYYRSNASFVQIPGIYGSDDSSSSSLRSDCLFRTSKRSHEYSQCDDGDESSSSARASIDDTVYNQKFLFDQYCEICVARHRKQQERKGERTSWLSPCQPISVVALEIHGRVIRLKVHISGTRQTIKLQNSFGQKGMAQFADLSDLVTEHGEPVHIIASMYSLIGRSACGQLLEQSNNAPAKVYSRSTGKFLGYGGYGHFFVSDDSPHANFIYSIREEGDNPIRMCRLTYESLLENNVSSAAFVKASEFESGANNPYAGMPRNVSSALRCYNMYDRDVSMTSQSTLATRRKMFDACVVGGILGK